MKTMGEPGQAVASGTWPRSGDTELPITLATARPLTVHNSLSTIHRGSLGGTLRWYRSEAETPDFERGCYDSLGSVLAEVDNTGTITASRAFDVYGSVRNSTGTSTSKHKFVGQLGHTSDDETGLIYMRARYMDPATGTFVSQDPGRSGANWYGYCNGNPIGFLDKTGRDDPPSVCWPLIPADLLNLFSLAARHWFLQGSLDGLVGIPVPYKYVTILENYLSSTGYDWLTFGATVAGFYHDLKWKDPPMQAGIGLAAVAIVETMVLNDWIAITAADMAFDEGR